MHSPIRLPYFDALLDLLEKGHGDLARTFGRHVHWGYWPEPAAAETSPEQFALASERLSELVCQAAEITAGQSILDAGCGFGGTSASLDAHHGGMTVVGLNIDRRQLLRAREQWHASPGNVLEWVQADACTLPFRNESFDAVLAVECIFHFPSRERFFREAHRILKPGGRLALSDFLPVPALRPALRLASLWPVSAGFYGRCHLHCTLEDYRRLAEATGFRVRLERDITANTLPTYTFLRRMVGQVGLPGVSAAIETLFAEGASRMGLLRYCVLSFEKPHA